MIDNSLSPDPAQDLSAGTGQPWGRITSGLADDQNGVTLRLPSGDCDLSLVNAARPDRPVSAGPAPIPQHTVTITPERATLLARLRKLGEQPPPAGPARRARPGELPPAALALVAAAVPPWRTVAHYAPSGSVPYSWEWVAGGYMRAAVAYVRCLHPDGRGAVAFWSQSKVYVGTHPKPVGVALACKTCPAKGPGPVSLNWRIREVWRYRIGTATTPGTFPVRMTLPALKTAVADPAARVTPYRPEEMAA